MGDRAGSIPVIRIKKIENEIYIMESTSEVMCFSSGKKKGMEHYFRISMFLVDMLFPSFYTENNEIALQKNCVEKTD